MPRLQSPTHCEPPLPRGTHAAGPGRRPARDPRSTRSWRGGLLDRGGVSLTLAWLSPAMLTLAWLSLAGCQGDFARPAYDNPNDPAGGELPPTPSVVKVECPTPPGTPGSQGVIPLDVEWTIDGESGIAEYQVFRSSSPAVDPGELILHVPAGTLTARDEMIEEGVEYFYRVRAVDTDGRLGRRSAPRSAVASCE